MLDVNLIDPEELKDLRDCETLMILSPEKLIDELKENLSINIPYFGGVFPGVIYEQKRYEDKIVAVRFYEKLKIFRDDKMPENADGTLIIFADSLYTPIEDILERTYFNYGAICYIGGGAGSLSFKQIDCLFDNRGFFRQGCIFANLKRCIDVAVKHGWKDTEQSLIATKTDGREIIELDWEQAFKAYRDSLNKMGVNIDEKNFFDVAKAYPFGISRIEGEHIIRDPLMLKDGRIVCAGKVPQNCLLTIMKGEKERLIEAAENCSRCVDADVVFVADCISRVLYLNKDFRKELRAIEKDCFGILTIGEIASSENFIEFHNKTIVVGGLV